MRSLYPMSCSTAHGLQPPRLASVRHRNRQCGGSLPCLKPPIGLSDKRSSEGHEVALRRTAPPPPQAASQDTISPTAWSPLPPHPQARYSHHRLPQRPHPAAPPAAVRTPDLSPSPAGATGANPQAGHGQGMTPGEGPEDLPPTPVGRAAWLGPEMAARPQEWQLSLSEGEVAEMEAAVAALVAEAEAEVAAEQEDEAGEGACGRAARVEAVLRRRLAHLTPDRFSLPTLGPRLQELRHELLHGRGFALLRRLPVERYTPLQSAAAFLGLGCHLGSARSQNARGHVLGHVADLGLSSTDPGVRIYQTRERQTFHTDSCDVVGLLCLREAQQGGDSLLVSADTLYDKLRERSPHLLRRLVQPMPHDRRGEVPTGQLPYFDIPVFSWHEGHLSVFYQRQYFDSAQRFPEARRLTEEDVAALDALDALANDPALHLTMRLAPGDMQFVHNHNMLHDRTAFTDHPDPAQRRHLLRLWLAVPGARPLPPAFTARYGSLTVGDRGGIVVPGTLMNVPLEPEA